MEENSIVTVEDQLKAAIKYYSIFNTIDAGFCIIELIYNDSGNIQDLVFRHQNQSFEKCTGSGNAVGKTMKELLPEFEQHFISTYKCAVETDESTLGEIHILSLDRWYKTHLMRLGNQDCPLAAVVFEDITATKKAKQYPELLSEEPLWESVEKYRDLFEKMDEGYCMIEMLYDEEGKAYDWRFLRVNPAFERHNGLSNATGKTIRELAPDIEQKWIDIYNHVAETGESIRFEEDSIALDRIFDLYAFRIDKPEQRRVAVLFTNITGRKQGEMILREREVQLEQLLKQRDEFIGIASHELKTPVTSIKGYATIIRDWLNESTDSNEKYVISRLMIQIDRLIILINHLLDTTRISEGQLTLTLAEFDFNALLSEMLEETSQITDHKIILETKPLRPIVADSERIGQVLTNLLTNAIKYSPKESTITITAYDTEDGISVSIKDEGQGIPDEDQQSIFERFFRVKTHKMVSYPGMGLGLYISAQIIYQHGGTIGVESKIDEGATFSFTLPYKVMETSTG